LQAFATKDVARLQALFITDTEIKALELPAAEATRLRQLQNSIAAKFNTATAKVTNLDKAKWVRFDANLPQCIPAEQLGTRVDLIKHIRGTVLYEIAGKHDFIQISEMILVGNAWRLTDVPGGPETKDEEQSPKLKAALEALRKQESTQ